MTAIRQETPVIVSKDGVYRLYEYKNESELERMIVEHAREIFGEETYYFDIKKKIKSRAGFGTVPDGYVIDFRDEKLYLVEVELIKHSLRRHIRPQIMDFIQALDNEETFNELVETFHERLPKSKKMEKENLKKLVKNWGIIIIIDELGDPMKEVNPLLEVVNFLSKFADVKAIPFQTYTKTREVSSDHLHSFKSFTRKELEEESKKWTFKWTTVSADKHISRLKGDSKKAFEELSRRICEISPEIKEVHRKNWATYQISKLGNFCTIKFPKGRVDVYLKVNKNDFIDEKRVTKDIKRTASWTFDKVFTINFCRDVDYAVSLIKQAHQCVCEPK